MKQKVYALLVKSSFLFFSFSFVLEATCSIKPLSSLTKTLQEKVGRLKKELEQQNARKLAELFHERKGDIHLNLKASFTKQKEVLGEPFAVAIQHIFAIDGEKTSLDCSAYKIYPHYGYSQQLLLLFSINGKTESGQVLMTLVPTKDDWRVGYYYFQRTTHLQKSAESWFLQARSWQKSGDELLGSLAYQLALLLTLDTPHFVAKEHETMIKEQSLALLQEKWLAHLQADLGPTLTAFSALMVKDGIGLGLKLAVGQQEYHTLDGAKACQELFARNKEKVWFKQIKGLSCSFFLKESQMQGAKVHFIALK